MVDALGPETRQEMVAWFCGWQFAPYKHDGLVLSEGDEVTVRVRVRVRLYKDDSLVLSEGDEVSLVRVS